MTILNKYMHKANLRFFTLVFLTIFLLLGVYNAVNDIIIANTSYYTIRSVTTDQDQYRACNKITLNYDRIATRDIQAESDTNLIRSTNSNGDGVDEKYILGGNGGLIAAGDTVIPFTRTLDCDLKTGYYYYEGTFSYSVEGIDKFEPWTSNVFEIVD